MPDFVPEPDNADFYREKIEIAEFVVAEATEEQGLVLHENSIKHHRAVHVSLNIDLEPLDWRE